MKVLLTHSYFYQLDKKQWKNHTPYPPLATITALSFLKKNEFKAEFYDVALDPGPEKVISKIGDVKPDVLVIYDDGFNYLTKMCLTNMRHACYQMIAKAKELGTTVILSSSDSTDHYEEYHKYGADIIIHGEAENTLVEVLSEIKNKKEHTANGISYKNHEEIVKTAPRLNVKNLDEFPQADWESVNLDSYKKEWQKGKFPFTLNISTTRGCPFKCNWCAKPIYGNRYNSRSPEKVVDEIEVLVNKYDVSNFWITDDIFGLKPGWVTEFNAIIQERKIQIFYKIQSRADLLMKDQTIDELIQSGLSEVWMGAESGSQKVLDAMDKGITIEQIDKSTELLQKKGARVAYFLQFGYLGEEREDIVATLDMVDKNKPDDIGISVSYPLPGTVFYDKVVNQMGDKSNWKDSDDLDLMFNGTYNSNYYRALQRFVHHNFRAKQGVRKILKPSKTISWRYVALIPYNFAVAKFFKLKLR